MEEIRIFLVEDDPALCEGIARLLETQGWQARTAKDFRDVLSEFAAFAPHLVLLDVKLPVHSGYHWCREIRRVSRVPVLFLSSAADNLNQVAAMDMGADDFVAKPFDTGLLVAKIRALLRRAYDFAECAVQPPLTHRGATLDTGAGVLRFAGKNVELTRNELRILLTLLENRGKVVSREKLMERLWDTDAFVDDNTLTVNVNRLRRKLEAAGLKDFIATRFGLGYQLA